MSSEGDTPTEILFYPYPDSLEKQVMNDLVENSTISKRKFQGMEIQPVVEIILDKFEEFDYVTSANMVDPTDGITYKTWTVTPFFQSRIQAQKDIIAADDVIKLALWNQKNQLLSSISSTPTPNNVRLLKSTFGAAGSAATTTDDTNEPLTESEINDLIKPELDALKKKMLGEFEEKRRLERLQEEEQEEEELEKEEGTENAV